MENLKAQCPKTVDEKVKSKTDPGNKITCNHCGKTHFAKQCKSKYHAKTIIAGKWEKEHKGTQIPQQPQAVPALQLAICEQYSGATTGSAGTDTPTTDTVTINTPDVVKVPLEARGPTGKGLSALLTGRSSAT